MKQPKLHGHDKGRAESTPRPQSFSPVEAEKCLRTSTRAVDEAVRLWDKMILYCSKTALGSCRVEKEMQKRTRPPSGAAIAALVEARALDILRTQMFGQSAERHRSGAVLS